MNLYFSWSGQKRVKESNDTFGFLKRNANVKAFNVKLPEMLRQLSMMMIRTDKKTNFQSLDSSLKCFSLHTCELNTLLAYPIALSNCLYNIIYTFFVHNQTCLHLLYTTELLQ